MLLAKRLELIASETPSAFSFRALCRASCTAIFGGFSPRRLETLAAWYAFRFSVWLRLRSYSAYRPLFKERLCFISAFLHSLQ